MSVQSQVDRIDGNVKKALAKIAEKGVSVPDDANSDDLEALIAAIEAGGGEGGADLGPFSQIVTGTITPSADMQNFALPDEVTDVVVALSIGYVGDGMILRNGTYLYSGGYAAFTGNGPDMTMNPIHVSIAVSSNDVISRSYPAISGRTIYLGTSHKLKAGHEYGYAICTRKSFSKNEIDNGGGGFN
jgi:hypothetical protein